MKLNKFIRCLLTTLTYDFTTEEGSYLASRCCCRILSVKVLQQRKHTHVQQNGAAEIQLVINDDDIVHMYENDVAKRRKSLGAAWRCLRLIPYCCQQLEQKI